MSEQTRAKPSRKSTQSSLLEPITHNTSVIVAAAGRGERLGAGAPKAFLNVEGQTLLELSLANINASEVADEIVVVVPEASLGVAADLVGAGVRVIAGGESRRESVAAGLAALADTQFVLVHDAARALTPAAVFQRVKASLTQGSQAVVPVVAVADTLKRVDAHGVVTETVNRQGLYFVQTPQGFQRDVLRRAHAEAPIELTVTDDASMVEWCGVEVSTVAGSTEAFKITEPGDLELARAILNSSRHK